MFVLTNSVEEVRALVAQGFVPVECSIGGVSIMDKFQMDHHGAESHREPVALRAYRDHFGAAIGRPGVVGVGAADADMCFAAAALMGLLPHPNRQVAETLSPPVKASLTQDLSALAATISRVDTNPIGLEIAKLRGGDLLLLWNAMTGAVSRTSLGFQTGVGLWQSLTEGNPVQLVPFLEAGKDAEDGRISASLLDLKERGQEVAPGVLLIKGSRVFGFPEWYGRNEADGGFHEPAGWKYPVVLAHVERGGNVTMGCPNTEVAEAIFGLGGLKNVFTHLQPEGWGGREAVGGSPRGVVLTADEAVQAAETVASLIRRNP